MRNIKTIFILVLSLILLLAVSCSNEDKTGGKTETTVTIDAKDFPTDLLGTYRDENVASAGYGAVHFNTRVSYDETTKKTKIEGTWLKDGTTDTYRAGAFIEKWTKTTKKYGKIIKLEGKMEDLSRGKAIVTYDYETKTLIGKFDWCYYAGTPKFSFNGKKI